MLGLLLATALWLKRLAVLMIQCGNEVVSLWHAERGLHYKVPTTLSFLNKISNKEWLCFIMDALTMSYPQQSNFLDGDDGVRRLLRYERGFTAMRRVCINGILQFESNWQRNKHEGCRKVLDEMFKISAKKKLGPEYPGNDDVGAVEIDGNIFKKFEHKWKIQPKRPADWVDEE